MFQALKQWAARLFGRRPPGADTSEDPYSGVRHPRTRRPGGRSAAVAVLEPEPEEEDGLRARVSCISLRRDTLVRQSRRTG